MKDSHIEGLQRVTAGLYFENVLAFEHHWKPNYRPVHNVTSNFTKYCRLMFSIECILYKATIYATT